MQINLSFMFHPEYYGISIHTFLPVRSVQVPANQNNIGTSALHPAERAQMAWPQDMLAALLVIAQGPARETQSFRERIPITMVSGNIW